MATVKIGSARIDEKGNTHGGVAGDQNGREVSTQPWYKHSKGWVVIRAKDAAVREKLAYAMERACANDKIGYDQYQRDTLYALAEKVGFDPGKVTGKASECDCSALVRVCCAHAGIFVPSFRTHNQPSVLKGTGAFTVLTDAPHTHYPNWLLRGDILCTPVSGHTVVVLSDGDAGTPDLRLGDHGEAVRVAQTLLNKHGASLGIDGDFGPLTEAAVRAFQKSKGVTVDGVIGPMTWAALREAQAPKPTPAPTAILRRGDKGDEVKQLQKLLTGLAVDGDFGPLTDVAVRAYQEKMKLSVDGIVGPKTWGALLH